MTTNNLTTAENFAASQVLTEWPDEMTYDQLLDAIKTNDMDVIVWDQFEDELPDDIIETIESLRVHFLNSVAAMTDALRQTIKDGDPMTIAEQLHAFERQLGETK